MIYVLNPIIWLSAIRYYYSLSSRHVSAFIFIFQPMTVIPANQYPKIQNANSEYMYAMPPTEGVKLLCHYFTVQ